MRRLLYSIFILILISSSVNADFVFPARLEIKETKPGIYNITFTLPVINNQKLKARPILPGVLKDQGDHKIQGDYTSYQESWIAACHPDSLYGKNIGIKGLVGTSVDILFTIELLSGRKYDTTLKPARALFTIPAPPSFIDFLTNPVLEGMRKHIFRFDMILLLGLVAFLRKPFRQLLLAVMTYTLAHLFAHYLGSQNYFLLSPQLIPLLILIIVLFSSFDLAKEKSVNKKWFQPLWPLTLLLGLLNGGTNPGVTAQMGFSFAEQYFVLMGYNLGILLSLVLIYLLFQEVYHGFTQYMKTNRIPLFHKNGGYVIGTISAGLLFYYGFYVFTIAFILPDIPMEVFILVLVMGIMSGYHHINQNKLVSLLLFISGIVLGLMEISLPYLSSLILGFTLFFAFLFIFRWTVSKKIMLVIFYLAVFFCSWAFSSYIQQNLTLPIATTTGTSGLILLLFYLSSKFISGSESAKDKEIVSFAIVVTFLTIIWRLAEYYYWFESEIISELSLGFLRIPLLSLILIILAVFIWPQKRKIHHKLEIQTRQSFIHWIILLLAFILIPYGTLRLSNPLFSGGALETNQAKRVLQQVLSSTYNAFNIDDENTLYEELAKSVSSDLIADVYLDSRRRLTSGVRQGAEVKVKNVSILSVGDIISGTNPNDGYSYQSKWTVTARVRHLQHVHHRRNIYSGILKVKIEDDRWKIASIELISEDREIIPGSAG